MSKQVCHEYMQKFPTGISVPNEERIKFMISHPVIKEKLDEWIELQNSGELNDLRNENGTLDHSQTRSDLIPNKNEEYALKKREEGNLLFKKRAFIESIHSYNEALRFMPISSSPVTGKTETSENIISLLFANRSAAYYELGDYKNSLLDTKLALKYGYPERLKIKVVVRKVNIYLKLGNIEEAEISLKEARECQEISKDAELKIKQCKIELEKVKKENSSSSSKTTTSRTQNETTTKSNSESESEEEKVQTLSNPTPKSKSTSLYPTLEDFDENPNFENASKDVEIHYSTYKTRYVKCKKRLQVGDIIFQEEPFSSVLIPEFYEKMCFQCHTYLEHDYFFPCTGCSQVKFCSEDCYSKAWEQCHKYECGSLDLLTSVGIAHLALRTSLIAGKRRILESLSIHKDSAQLSKSLNVFNKGEDSYLRVLSLLDHMDDMNVEDMFQYSLTASLLVNFLMKKTNFFDDVSEEDMFKIGGVLLKHVCQLICNAHAVTFIASDHNVQNMSATTVEESQVRIASAIYPSASIMNHSCEPNIASSFYHGRTLLVRLTSDLRKGAEVYNCYGPHSRRMNRDTRQEILQGQYFFNCDCNACERELEDGYSFVDKFSALKCSKNKCGGPVVPNLAKQTFLVECQDCGSFENIETNLHNALRIGKMISMGSSKLDESKTADALNIFLEAHKLCEKSLYKFNSDFGKVNDLLAHCYSILGNSDSAIPYLEESLNYVLERFGESSVEYARELKKFGELLEFSSSSNTTETKAKIEDCIENSNRILELYIV